MSDNNIVVVSDVDPNLVVESLEDPNGVFSGNQTWMEPVKRAVASWAEDTRGPSRKRGIFQRDKYVTPGKIFEQMALAEEAMDDDVVSGVYETSESMAFKKMGMESEDPDQANVWNQIARDVDLDSFLRMAWRELFKNSQYYGVSWWANKTYKVEGKGEQRARRKTFDLRVPVALGVLDPTRVVPVNLNIFGEHDLAWIAEPAEATLFEDVLSGNTQDDETVRELIVKKYVPSKTEEKQLQKEGVPTDQLFLLNPATTWMGHATKASYERWSRVRMKSIMPLLDMKHQLREMDRAFLLGGINFIVLVKKGTDQLPVKKESELTMVTQQMRSQAKSSVIVSDHRLDIEIITPDLEHILDPLKYGTLDDRIRIRLWGSISGTSGATTRDTELTLAKVVALGLENRRHMLKRDVEKHVIRQVGFLNEDMDVPASIEYAPRRIDLAFDPAVATIFQEIRDRGELSRETILDEFGFSLPLERHRRQEEKTSGDDEIFESVNVPFNGKDDTTPSGSGKKAKKEPKKVENQ